MNIPIMYINFIKFMSTYMLQPCQKINIILCAPVVSYSNVHSFSKQTVILNIQILLNFIPNVMRYFSVYLVRALVAQFLSFSTKTCFEHTSFEDKFHSMRGNHIKTYFYFVWYRTSVISATYTHFLNKLFYWASK